MAGLIIPRNHHRPPGWDAPNLPGDAQKRAVQDMLNAMAADVAALDPAAMRALMPALMDAKREVAAGLTAWLKNGVDNDKRFTAHEMKRVMLALDHSMDVIAKLNPQFQKVLEDMRKETGHLATKHLKFEVARMAHVFGGSGGLGTAGIQLSTAAVMTGAKKELIKRHRNSANRYVGNVRKDIRHQFAVGLARNETFHQMGQRLRKLGGPRGRVALRGTIGDANAWVEDIPEGLFARYEHWAERLVRTETMNAYNVQHADGIDALNGDLDDDEDEFLKRWDATLDNRLCTICGPLDRVAVKADALFPGGYEHPPAHPYCRCVVVAWHPSWGDIEGETRSREFTGEMPAVAPDAFVGAAAEAKAAGVRVSADRERSMDERRRAREARAKERKRAQAEQERAARIVEPEPAKEPEQVEPAKDAELVPFKFRPMVPGERGYRREKEKAKELHRKAQEEIRARRQGISVEEMLKRERLKARKEADDRSVAERKIFEKQAEEDRAKRGLAKPQAKADSLAAKEAEKEARAERVRQEMLEGLSGSAREKMQVLLDRAKERRDQAKAMNLGSELHRKQALEDRAKRQADKLEKAFAKEELFQKNEKMGKAPSLADERRKERSKHIAEAYEAELAAREYKKAEKAFRARMDARPKNYAELARIQEAELNAAKAAGGDVLKKYWERRDAEAQEHVTFSAQGRADAKNEERKAKAQAAIDAFAARGGQGTPPKNEGWVGRQLRGGQIVESESLGGGVTVTELVKVDMGEGPVDAVWKPRAGEGDKIRTNVTPGSYWRHEAAASNIAHHFQVDDLVPKTVARKAIMANGEAQPGSLQQFVPSNGNPKNLALEDIERARVFDFATGNSDRHGGNIMFRQHANGHTIPVLIDNGLAFPEGVPDRVIQPPMVRNALEAIGGDQRRPSKRTLEIIGDLDEVAIARDMIRSGIGDKATISAVKRIRAMKADPAIVGYSVGGDEYQQDYDWRLEAQKAEKMKVDSELISIIERAKHEAALAGEFPLE